MPSKFIISTVTSQGHELDMAIIDREATILSTMLTPTQPPI